MNRFNRLLRAACTALTAALMAGCAAYLIARAAGFAISWAPVYLLAMAAAGAVQLGKRGTAWTIGAAVALVAGLGALLAAYASDISDALRTMAMAGPASNLSAYASAGLGAGMILALVLGALMALLMQMPGGVPFALMMLLASVVCSLAVSEDISLWAALPGVAAGVAAFALPAGGRREGVRPGLLIPAAVLALIALLISPAGRTTWKPMEELAQRIRSVVEDYIRFTEERVAFSINEEGYDHAGMIGDEVVAMLGGPADPAENPVMKVKADSSMLLRGTIKRSYTGYSWVDDQAKARYLYYDFTHRSVRSSVFDTDTAKGSEGFMLREASVEMISNGTSTLFVPAQLAGFEMSLADAVYYNSAGEMFLTRDVQAGDSYSLSARVPRSESGLIAACAQKSTVSDKRYADILSQYTVLPEGIDSRVYALAVELTQHTNNPAEKAYAIQNHLAQNYRYTLEGGYPEAGEDFVSWFLLESQEGYCSYFASSMAVMCRIAGVPTRYVEGYYVPRDSGNDGVIITGRNAHAWVEIYLNGLGWVAFDPTARAVEQQFGEDALDESGTPPDHGSVDEPGREPDAQDDLAGDPTPSPTPDVGSDPDPTPSPTPDAGSDSEPTPSPTPDADNDSEPTPSPTPDASNDSEPTPSPTPDADSDSEPTPSPTPEPDDPTPPPQDDSEDPDDPDNKWIWIVVGILLLLALIALAVLLVRRRLAATDPLKLCAATRSAQMAAMILYRGILALLAQIGQAPQGGETPEAFAQRVCAILPNPDYERFVADVVRSRYSGRNVNRETLNAGRNAYVVFMNGMRRGERVRFCLRRLTHGLGSFENIP